MDYLEGTGSFFPFPDNYTADNTHNFHEEDEPICTSTDNSSLMIRVKNIHIAFQQIGFDHGINTALHAAKEQLSAEEKAFIRDRFGLSREQLRTISYENLSEGPDKLARNQRVLEIMNAIFVLTNNDSLDEMEITTETIIAEMIKLN